MSDTDVRKKRLAKWFMVGVTILVIAVAAPIIFSALQGLLALILFLLVGGTAIALAPMMAMKFANWKLKGIKAEARKNPIETMTNVLIVKARDWDAMKKKVEDFSAAVANFETKVKSLVREYPDQATEFQEQLDGMKKLLQLRLLRLKEAKSNLQAFEAEINKQKARYEVALAALAAENAGKNFSDEEVYEKIKLDESFDTVEQAMNTAFAQLNSSLMELEYNPSKGAKIQIPANADLVIDS